MCQAFPSGKVRRGRHRYKMVARSISARLDRFESTVHALFFWDRAVSSASSAEGFLIADSIDGSRSPCMSCDCEGCSKSNEKRAKIWGRSRTKSAEIQVGDVKITQSEGSKWTQFVRKLKGYVGKDFEGPIYVQNQSSVRDTSKAALWTPRVAGPTSAQELPPQKIPIWQRRNKSPVPPLQIHNVPSLFGPGTGMLCTSLPMDVNTEFFRRSFQ